MLIVFVRLRPSFVASFSGFAMPAASSSRAAKRAFVTVILALAAVYGLVAAITRESDDVAVHAAYRRVVKRAHPDKGGSAESAQKLQAAREAWLNAQKENKEPRQNAEPGGRQRATPPS